MLPERKTNCTLPVALRRSRLDFISIFGSGCKPTLLSEGRQRANQLVTHLSTITLLSILWVVSHGIARLPLVGSWYRHPAASQVMQPHLPPVDTQPMVPRDHQSGQNAREGQRSTFASKGMDLAMYADRATMYASIVPGRDHSSLAQTHSLPIH